MELCALKGAWTYAHAGCEEMWKNSTLVEPNFSKLKLFCLLCEAITVFLFVLNDVHNSLTSLLAKLFQSCIFSHSKSYSGSLPWPELQARLGQTRKVRKPRRGTTWVLTLKENRKRSSASRADHVTRQIVTLYLWNPLGRTGGLQQVPRPIICRILDPGPEHATSRSDGEATHHYDFRAFLFPVSRWCFPQFTGEAIILGEEKDEDIKIKYSVVFRTFCCPNSTFQAGKCNCVRKPPTK